MHTLKALWPSCTEAKLCSQTLLLSLSCNSSHVVHPTCNSQVPLKGRLREGWVVTVTWPCTSQNPWLQKSAKPCAITVRHPPNDVHNTINSLSVWLLQICMKLFFLNLGSLGSPNQMSAPCWLLVSTWTHERGINGAKSLCLDMRCNELWGFGLLLHPVTKQQLEQPGGYHGYPNFRNFPFLYF